MKKFLIFLALSLSLYMAADEFYPKVHVYSNPASVGAVCAKKIVDTIQANQQRGLPTVLGLATGATPIPLYQALVKLVKEEGVDMSTVITFNLDEYTSLAPNHPGSYHTFMYENLFKELGVKPENIHLPNAYAKHLSDLTAKEKEIIKKAFPKRGKDETLSCEEEMWILKRRSKEYESEIARLGPIDIQLLGIGSNGHIGFAEPGSSFQGITSIVQLTERTRQDNSRFFKNFEDVPKFAMTMGIQTILQAKQLILLATGKQKSKIIQQVLQKKPTEDIPATALKLHPQADFFLDREAACKLVLKFYNGKVLRDHELKEEELWVKNGKIISSQQHCDVSIDVEGAIIAPGYIDLQINGGFGVDFLREPERVEEVAKRLPKYGVTSFLPTLVSAKHEDYRRVLDCLREKMEKQQEGAKILGFHLEGPFFSPEMCRAHDPSLLLSCEKFTVPEEVYGSLTGVRIVTLAPELPNAENMIQKLKKQGIIVSAGHSKASSAQLENAVHLGIGLVTHLFNGMPSFHHRDPGIVGAVLTHPDLPFLLIGDRHHLDPKALKLAWNTRSNGLILVTDAISALGLKEGIYNLGPLEVEVRSAQALIKGTHVIAGSTVSLDRAVQYLQQSTGCSVVSAIEAASLKPAELLGISDRKGSLHVGADADFNLLDPDLTVQACFIGGALSASF